jgi:hypothetical protein
VNRQLHALLLRMVKCCQHETGERRRSVTLFIARRMPEQGGVLLGVREESARDVTQHAPQARSNCICASVIPIQSSPQRPVRAADAAAKTEAAVLATRLSFDDPRRARLSLLPDDFPGLSRRCADAFSPISLMCLGISYMARGLRYTLATDL